MDSCLVVHNVYANPYPDPEKTARHESPSSLRSFALSKNEEFGQRRPKNKEMNRFMSRCSCMLILILTLTQRKQQGMNPHHVFTLLPALSTKS